MNTPGQLLRAALTGGLLTALLASAASAASLGAGVVNVDALRLREEASTDSAILATAANEDAVILLEEAEEGWYQVSYNGLEGYMSGEYLDVLSVATMDLGYGQVAAEGATLNLRDSNSTDGKVLASIPDGTVLELKGIADGWYLVSYGGHTGYVSSDYITITDAAALADQAVPMAGSPLGQQIVDYAKQFLGVPYVYGANGPSSFDCSGFTSYVYRAFGYSLNRTASGQQYNGVAVTMDQLQPGDLILFRCLSTSITHVGIYIGGGEFIHAASTGYHVQIDQLFTGYYAGCFAGGRRII